MIGWPQATSAAAELISQCDSMVSSLPWWKSIHWLCNDVIDFQTLNSYFFQQAEGVEFNDNDPIPSITVKVGYFIENTYCYSAESDNAT